MYINAHYCQTWSSGKVTKRAAVIDPENGLVMSIAHSKVATRRLAHKRGIQTGAHIEYNGQRLDLTFSKSFQMAVVIPEEIRKQMESESNIIQR